MNTEIVEKIKRLRRAKGYNHEDMADRLHISTSAYQRLESGETYTWSKYLNELMETLEITPQEFFKDIGASKVFNQNYYDGSTNYIVDTLYKDNKEVYEKLIQSKDEQIALLKSVLDQKF